MRNSACNDKICLPLQELLFNQLMDDFLSEFRIFLWLLNESDKNDCCSSAGDTEQSFQGANVLGSPPLSDPMLFRQLPTSLTSHGPSKKKIPG